MSEEKETKKSSTSLVDTISTVDAVLNAVLKSEAAKGFIGTYQNGEARTLSDVIAGEYVDPKTRLEFQKRKAEKAKKVVKPVIEVTIGEKPKKKKKKDKKKNKKKIKKKDYQYIDLKLPKEKKKKKKKGKKGFEYYRFYE